MFVINHPRLMQLQSRLARMPRWGWIAIFIGVVLPIVVLGAGLLVVALVSGIAVLLLVAIVRSVLGLFRGVFPRRIDDGRRNVKIVVHSARVIDP